MYNQEKRWEASKINNRIRRLNIFLDQIEGKEAFRITAEVRERTAGEIMVSSANLHLDDAEVALKGIRKAVWDEIIRLKKEEGDLYKEAE